MLISSPRITFLLLYYLVNPINCVQYRQTAFAISSLFGLVLCVPIMAIRWITPLVLVASAHGFGTSPATSAVGCGGRDISRRGGRGVSLRAGASTITKKGGDDGNGDDAIKLPWPPKADRIKDYSLMPGEIAVRFINAPGRYPSGAFFFGFLNNVSFNAGKHRHLLRETVTCSH